VLVIPVVWIETLHPLSQPVPFLGSPATAQDPLLHVGVPGTEAGSLFGAEGPAEEALVVTNDRYRNHRTRRRRARR
jgi:hypothetical protein